MKIVMGKKIILQNLFEIKLNYKINQCGKLVKMEEGWHHMFVQGEKIGKCYTSLN